MRTLKRIAAVLAVVYVLFSIINLTVSGVMVLNKYNDLLASFIMLFLCIAYYYQLVNKRELVSLRNDLAFWVSTGLLINHLGNTMSLFFINLLAYSADKLHIIIMFAAFIMYLTYSIGYLCHNKTLSGRQ
jgi:hypothetical protein